MSTRTRAVIVATAATVVVLAAIVQTAIGAPMFQLIAAWFAAGCLVFAAALTLRAAHR